MQNREPGEDRLICLVVELRVVGGPEGLDSDWAAPKAAFSSALRHGRRDINHTVAIHASHIR